MSGAKLAWDSRIKVDRLLIISRHEGLGVDRCRETVEDRTIQHPPLYMAKPRISAVNI